MGVHVMIMYVQQPCQVLLRPQHFHRTQMFDFPRVGLVSEHSYTQNDKTRIGGLSDKSFPHEADFRDALCSHLTRLDFTEYRTTSTKGGKPDIVLGFSGNVYIFELVLASEGPSVHTNHLDRFETHPSYRDIEAYKCILKHIETY